MTSKFSFFMWLLNIKTVFRFYLVMFIVSVKKTMIYKTIITHTLSYFIYFRDIIDMSKQKTNANLYRYISQIRNTLCVRRQREEIFVKAGISDLPSGLQYQSLTSLVKVWYF